MPHAGGPQTLEDDAKVGGQVTPLVIGHFNADVIAYDAGGDTRYLVLERILLPHVPQERVSQHDATAQAVEHVLDMV